MRKKVKKMFCFKIKYKIRRTACMFCSLRMDVEVANELKANQTNLSNKTIDENRHFEDIRFEHYVAFTSTSIVCTFLLMLTSIMNFMLCTMAARIIHDKIFIKLLHSPMSFFHQQSIGEQIIQGPFASDVVVPYYYMADDNTYSLRRAHVGGCCFRVALSKFLSTF